MGGKNMICKKCSYVNNDESKFCQNCGELLEAPAKNVQTEIINNNSALTVHVPQKHLNPTPKAKSLGDVFTILGFVFSIVSFFWFGIVLAPCGLGFSIYGYRKNNTKKLAVAGIVIAALSVILKICSILTNLDFIPEWVLSGVLS